jgi:hypothetical protein
MGRKKKASDPSVSSRDHLCAAETQTSSLFFVRDTNLFSLLCQRHKPLLSSVLDTQEKEKYLSVKSSVKKRASKVKPSVPETSVQDQDLSSVFSAETQPSSAVLV